MTTKKPAPSERDSDSEAREFLDEYLRQADDELARERRLRALDAEVRKPLDERN